MAHDPFAPPPEDKRPLELEAEWAHEKAAKQATAVAHDTAAARRSRAWIGAAIGVVVAGVVAAGVVVQLRANTNHAGHGALPATPNTIGIEVRSKYPALITIDGHKAGRAPLTLHVPKGTTPLQISDGKQLRSVIPDHDQTVDFVTR